MARHAGLQNVDIGALIGERRQLRDQRSKRESESTGSKSVEAIRNSLVQALCCVIVADVDADWDRDGRWLPIGSNLRSCSRLRRCPLCHVRG